jgi:glutathione-S-conjugate glycine hydrolase
MRLRRLASAAAAGVLLLGAAGTYWIASPTKANLALPAPLESFDPHSTTLEGLPYAKDFAPLARSFRPQTYLSFCGPASLATVLRAYGNKSADQTTVFPSWNSKLKAFYSGMTLAELDELARTDGLRTQLVYADTLSLEQFRELLKSNLAHKGDFVLVNYDRRALQQVGAGHISPVGAYDEAHDAFLVLDEASYHYPFTWVPARMLYEAVHTTDSPNRFRGVLFINGYR